MKDPRAVFKARRLDGRELPATAGVRGNAFGEDPPGRPSQAEVVAERTGQTLEGGAGLGMWDLSHMPWSGGGETRAQRREVNCPGSHSK